ncbi:MAG: pilus assembly protein N-terminal domain-containing protein [Pseudomonadota bacterium]
MKQSGIFHARAIVLAALFAPILALAAPGAMANEPALPIPAPAPGSTADAAPAVEPTVEERVYQARRGIYVTVDQAKVIRIDHEADTVIIGNPAIADAHLHDRKTLVITGRAFGATNLLILDASGELVVDEALRVQPAEDTVVTVQRRALNFTYSCTPLCRPAVSPGDQTDFFENAVAQSERRSEFASQAAGAN